MTPKKHLIALVGFGTVAKGLCQILHDKRDKLLNEHGFDFEIVAVTTRSRGTMYQPQGILLAHLLELSKTAGPFSEHLNDWDAETMIRNSNATVVVELAHTNIESAEPALTHCRAAFETGKHVICGNKGPAAVAYDEMKALASQQNRFFLNEATVLSGTPVFSFAKTALAGNTIQGIRGILNGASNFMLSEMEAGTPYTQALELAESLGYLEADHTADIDGYDAQAKLVILANILMGTTLQLDVVKRTGINSITPEDIQSAKQNQERWKLIATLKLQGETIHAEVKPEKLALSDPLAHVMGTTNSITFSTDLLGDITITGPGAGSMETGYSILSDLLTINNGESL